MKHADTNVLGATCGRSSTDVGVGCRRDVRSRLELGEHNAGVVTTEAKGVGQRRLNSVLLLDVGYGVNVGYLVD